MKVKMVKLKKPYRFKLDDINLEQVEVIASLGLTDEEIAVILGISPRTLNYWKKNPEFLQALKRGKLEADFQVTKKLYENAKNGDNTAIIFWLKNRRPDLWRDRSQVELSGQVAVPDNKLIVEVVHVRGDKK
ncbi:MAG: hypothetical protein QW835_07285 [Candidatus Hadarchaeum sp.]